MIKSINLDYDKDALKRCIDRFPQTRVLVVGDIMMDRYIWGDVTRISPEAPVPVVEVRQETKMLGGAANVINNLRSLGSLPILCGVVGDDVTGHEVIEIVRDLGLITDGIVVESDRMTSIKTRIVAHHQQVVRIDRENRKKIRSENTASLIDFIRERIDRLDVIVVADYGKGVISAELMKGLRELAMGSDIILAVDPKTDHFEYYQGVDVITPNQFEAGAFCRMEITDEDSLIQAGRYILGELHCKSVLITQGKDGMTLFETSGEITHIPTVARQVFDVSGAGDTVISTFCLGLASGMAPQTAAIISNFAAGIVVGEVGTSTVKAEDLKRAIGS